MRIALVLTVLAITSFVPHVALADEFGDRFYNRAPQGLGDYTVEDNESPNIAMDDAAEELQTVMPAAGDEEETPVAEDDGSISSEIEILEE